MSSVSQGLAMDTEKPLPSLPPNLNKPLPLLPELTDLGSLQAFIPPDTVEIRHSSVAQKLQDISQLYQNTFNSTLSSAFKASALKEDVTLTGGTQIDTITSIAGTAIGAIPVIPGGGIAGSAISTGGGMVANYQRNQYYKDLKALGIPNHEVKAFCESLSQSVRNTMQRRFLWELQNQNPGYRQKIVDAFKFVSTTIQGKQIRADKRLTLIEQRAVNDAQTLLIKLIENNKNQKFFAQKPLNNKIEDAVKTFCEQQQKTQWYSLTRKNAPLIEFDPGYIIRIKPALNIQLDDHIKLKYLENTCIKLQAELEKLMSTLLQKA